MKRITFIFYIFMIGCMDANIEQSWILAETGCERIDFSRNGQTIQDSLGRFSVMVNTNKWKVQKEINRNTSSIIIGKEESNGIPTVMINMGPLIGKWNLENEKADLSYQAEIVDNGRVRLHSLGSFYWFRIRETDPFIEFLYLVEPDTVNNLLFSIILTTLDESDTERSLCELEGITVGLKKIK